LRSAWATERDATSKQKSQSFLLDSVPLAREWTVSTLFSHKLGRCKDACLRISHVAKCQWLMPIILAIWEAEVRGIKV
jgi:hypothetical protein